jgi:hypothetical protein
MVLIMSPLNPVHIVTPYFFKIYFIHCNHRRASLPQIIELPRRRTHVPPVKLAFRDSGCWQNWNPHLYTQLLSSFSPIKCSEESSCTMCYPQAPSLMLLLYLTCAIISSRLKSCYLLWWNVMYELRIGAKSVHSGYISEKVVVSKIKKIPA